MSSPSDAMQSTHMTDVEMLPELAPDTARTALQDWYHQLPDWAADEVMTGENVSVPDVMDFLADLAERRQMLLRLLKRDG